MNFIQLFSDTIMWGSRLLCIAFLTAGLLLRNDKIFCVGISGSGGIIVAWGIVEAINGNVGIGLIAALFGFMAIAGANLYILKVRKKRGLWIRVDGKLFWMPPGVTHMRIKLEAPNPATKIEKSIRRRPEFVKLPGENEEDYKKRMR